MKPSCPRSGRRRSPGQVIVEVILILPFFLAIVFTILEMGNIAYHVIIIQHATWETARYGAMLAAPKGGVGGGMNVNKGVMQTFLQRIVKEATVKGAYPSATIPDPQAGITSYDLVLTTEFPIRLIFPITNIALARPAGTGTRLVEITLRMPIEQPLLK
ncbi:MAG: pilus assembly protein [Elusimicrobia bacterium]|nr:pilus assembly protein [Elusimicrobiota bacterium]